MYLFIYCRKNYKKKSCSWKKREHCGFRNRQFICPTSIIILWLLQEVLLKKNDDLILITTLPQYNFILHYLLLALILLYPLNLEFLFIFIIKDYWIYQLIICILNLIANHAINIIFNNLYHFWLHWQHTFARSLLIISDTNNCLSNFFMFTKAFAQKCVVENTGHFAAVHLTQNYGFHLHIFHRSAGKRKLNFYRKKLIYMCKKG